MVYVYGYFYDHLNAIIKFQMAGIIGFFSKPMVGTLFLLSFSESSPLLHFFFNTSKAY
jgi:hypothetical protein